MKAFMACVLSLFVCIAHGCSFAGPDAAATAGTVYFGGNIITVNDAQPTVDAVAVKDGKIPMLEARTEIGNKCKGESTRMIDLAGKTLLLGFLDSTATILVPYKTPELYALQRP
jgi:hypothetical protein